MHKSRSQVRQMKEEHKLNAEELMRQKYPPLNQAVEGVFPFGQLAVVGGHTGTRKSWTVDELALAVSEGYGSQWMGMFNVPNPAPVLLIANEDNYARVQSRLKQIRAARPPVPLSPEAAKLLRAERNEEKRLKLELKLRKQAERQANQRLDIRVGSEFPTYQEGGMDVLREWVEAENRPTVVIFDVFANFRELEGTIRRDRRIIREVGRFAHETGALVVLVMHMRKGVIRENSNWTDNLVGSSGVGAATDVKFGINAIEGASEGRLLMYGKDILNQAYKLELTEAGVWKAGADEGVIIAKSGREISAQRKLLLKVVAEYPGRTPAQIHDIRPLGPDGKEWSPNTVKQTLYQMWKKSDPPQLINEGGGYYTPEFIKNRDQNQTEMWSPTTLPAERPAGMGNPFHVVH